jgi:hypothetical protein
MASIFEEAMKQLPTLMTAAAPLSMTRAQPKSTTPDTSIADKAVKSIETQTKRIGKATIASIAGRIAITAGTSTLIAGHFGLLASPAALPYIAGVGITIIVLAFAMAQYGLYKKLYSLIILHVNYFLPMVDLLKIMSTIVTSLHKDAPEVANKIDIRPFEEARTQYTNFVYSICSPEQQKLIEQAIKTGKLKASYKGKPKTWKERFHRIGKKVASGAKALVSPNRWFKFIKRVLTPQAIITEVTFRFQNLSTAFNLLSAEFSIFTTLYSDMINKKGLRGILQDTEQYQRILERGGTDSNMTLTVDGIDKKVNEIISSIEERLPELESDLQKHPNEVGGITQDMNIAAKSVSEVINQAVNSEEQAIKNAANRSGISAATLEEEAEEEEDKEEDEEEKLSGGRRRKTLRKRRRRKN